MWTHHRESREEEIESEIGYRIGHEGCDGHSQPLPGKEHDDEWHFDRQRDGEGQPGGGHPLSYVLRLRRRIASQTPAPTTAVATSPPKILKSVELRHSQPPGQLLQGDGSSPLPHGAGIEVSVGAAFPLERWQSGGSGVLTIASAKRPTEPHPAWLQS